ncbi:energy-coupling factor transporter transmembrane component T [Virgibacillus dakarensis]|uniref:energy-coupling factor transporter transmembrane component T n=1 Tax=Virgibacillus dakarensis TaxID=1917889 RepID=UPI000B42DDEC|nr:energy-coupling factor transporter transmembrane component T [Virgibacillus dakarensis]
MDSRIGKLYPSSKFAFIILIILLSMFTPGYTMQYMVLPLILIISVFSGTAVNFLTTFIKSIFILVLFIFILQVFIIVNDDSEKIWGFIHFSQMGLMTSLSMTSKIVAISSCIIWFFQVTSVKDIIYALEKSGVSRKVTFVIASTIQLIPQMLNLSKTITDAQKSRGAETEGKIIVRLKAFVPMIGPLVLSSIQQIEERVLALESRAFSSQAKKTSIYELEKQPADYMIVTFCVLILIGYIVWRILS